MRKEMTVADKLQRTFNNLPQEKKDRINKILENYEEAIFATPHEPRNEEKLVQEITTLREQVEKLTKERDALVNAIDNEMVVTHMGVFNLGDDPKVALNKICCYAQDLGKFFAEDACKEQLAALAEQNTKLKEAINLIYSWANNWDSEFMNDPDWQEKDYPFIQSAISLPNLTTPALNRIKAEAYREAAEIVEQTDVYTFTHGGNCYDDGGITLTYAADAIRAKADELEQSDAAPSA